ncbi:50S ribosomal protein L24 [Candidatus Falkowbacteria bacterium]|jgi:large subunit ribosomal protein L24|nr:50S ribosomal protein L24 [Candidatus Falkowbacteria bacterium]MBT4433005.1 50S ribosomal protein L24 [Candidatus Falkowbacteria bacterium]
MKIKKGDKVKIINGKDRGKSGKVLKVSKTAGKISVEGLNLRVKHMRPKKQGEKGQRIQFPAGIDVSNVKLVCPKCSKDARIAYKVLEDKNKVRICKKCKEII